MDRLKAVASNGYNQRIFVRGDTQANYGKVMEVMGMLAAAGFTHIGLVTDVVKAKARRAVRWRRKPPSAAGRPPPSAGPRYGVVGSVLFHGLIFAAALFTFHRNFETPEESHVVPVDLVTIADKTNVAAQAPPTPPVPEKMDIPPSPPTPPPEPELQDVEPAPVPPVPDFKVAKEKPVDEKPPVQTKKQQRQDFNDLLNKLTTPDKPVKAAKAGPRVIQGDRAGNADDGEPGGYHEQPIYRCWVATAGVPQPHGD